MPRYDDMPYDNCEPPVEFHKFINDSYEADMLESAFKAISSVKDGWDFMKTYEPPEGEGFMFNRNPPAKLQEIEAAVLKADSGHSGASFGFTMRVMQRIAKYGFERYYDERSEPVEPKETSNQIIARLEKENASLRAQVATLTAPKKELTREQKIRAALAKGCVGGYPCPGCLARKNMLVEDWYTEQEKKRATENAPKHCRSCGGDHWSLCCPHHPHGPESYKPEQSNITNLIASATAVDTFLASGPPNNIVDFANAIQKDEGMRKQIPDIDQQADAMRKFASGNLSYAEMRSLCG